MNSKGPNDIFVKIILWPCEYFVIFYGNNYLETFNYFNSRIYILESMHDKYHSVIYISIYIYVYLLSMFGFWLNDILRNMSNKGDISNRMYIHMSVGESTSPALPHCNKLYLNQYLFDNIKCLKYHSIP